MYSRTRLGMGDTMGLTANQLATGQVVSDPLQAALGTDSLTTPQGSIDYQYCVNNGGWPGVLYPSCWATVFTQQNTMSIPQAYLQGAAAGTTPPDQATINAQTPDQTINQILANSQASAVAAAVAAAGSDQGANPSSGVCTQGGPNYNGLLCWISQNQQLVEIGAAIVIGIIVVRSFSR